MEPSIVETLTRLVAVPTVSRRPDLELLDYVEAQLSPAGVRVERFAYDGGTALNIVPHFSRVEFEIRPIAGNDPETIVRALEADALAITAPYDDCFPEARIAIERLSDYPGLEPPDDSPLIARCAGCSRRLAPRSRSPSAPRARSTSRASASPPSSAAPATGMMATSRTSSSPFPSSPSATASSAPSSTRSPAGKHREHRRAPPG